MENEVMNSLKELTGLIEERKKEFIDKLISSLDEEKQAEALNVWNALNDIPKEIETLSGNLSKIGMMESNMFAEKEDKEENTLEEVTLDEEKVESNEEVVTEDTPEEENNLDVSEEPVEAEIQEEAVTEDALEEENNLDVSEEPVVEEAPQVEAEENPAEAEVQEEVVEAPVVEETPQEITEAPVEAEVQEAVVETPAVAEPQQAEVVETPVVEEAPAVAENSESVVEVNPGEQEQEFQTSDNEPKAVLVNVDQRAKLDASFDTQNVLQAEINRKVEENSPAGTTEEMPAETVAENDTVVQLPIVPEPEVNAAPAVSDSGDLEKMVQEYNEELTKGNEDRANEILNAINEVRGKTLQKTAA